MSEVVSSELDKLAEAYTKELLGEATEVVEAVLFLLEQRVVLVALPAVLFADAPTPFERVTVRKGFAATCGAGQKQGEQHHQQDVFLVH